MSEIRDQISEGQETEGGGREGTDVRDQRSEGQETEIRGRRTV